MGEPACSARPPAARPAAPAASARAAGEQPLNPFHPRRRAPQALTDGDRVAHCRELAERGLSDLRAYQAAAAGSTDSNISLKGATH